jgi:hypothetical protein
VGREVSEAGNGPHIEFAYEPETKAPAWDILMDGNTVGRVRLSMRTGKFEVTIDTAMGYGKAVQKAVDEAEHQTVDDIKAAVLRGYAEHLKVLERLKIVDRESRPKLVSIPMGGQPK